MMMITNQHRNEQMLRQQEHEEEKEERQPQYEEVWGTAIVVADASRDNDAAVTVHDSDVDDHS